MPRISVMQYSIATAILATMFAVGQVIMIPRGLPCIAPLGFYLILMGYIYGQVFVAHGPYRTMIGSLLTLTLFPLTITPLYWLFGYAPWYPYVPLIIGALLGGYMVWKYPIKRPVLTPRSLLHAIPAFIVAVPNVVLLFFVLSRMSGDTIYSPWSLFGPRFWLLAALILLLNIVLATYHSKTALRQYLLLSSWYALVYSMIVLTHRYAFGFDQHIHLASMEWIRTHGLLKPKVPYYLGQYFLAIPLAEITNLSLDWISRLLVPLGTALALPLILLRSTLPLRTLLLLPLLPLGFLTFTTPNNLALVCALLVVCLLACSTPPRSWHTHALVAALVAVALITHALIGVPLLALVALIYSRTTWQRAGSLVLLIASVPLLLSLFGGATTIVFEPQVFARLFAQPHWYIGTGGSTWLQTVYAYKMYLLVPLLAGITASGAWHYRKEHHVQMLLLGGFGILVAAASIATMLRFPALIAYEQSSYAGRLLSLAFVCMVPLFLLGLRRLTVRPWLAYLCIPLLLISWYFTYPTRDAISYYTGVSIRDADVEAIEFIDTHAAGEPYIVLTNQMVSAAALSRFGFEGYRTVPSGTPEYLYAIPTGGPLYQYFREYIYEGYERSAIEDAMAFAGVEQAYLIHTNYWAPAAEIRDVSKEVADEWWEIGGGRVWVYGFEK